MSSEIGEVHNIMRKHGFDPTNEDAAYDALRDQACSYDLYEYYSEDMPYGVQKGREATPEEWIWDRWSRIGV